MTSSFHATLSKQAAPTGTPFGGGHAMPGLATDNPLVALMLDNSPDCLQLLDLTGRFLFMNGPGLALMEIDDVTPLKGQPWARLWPLDATDMVAASIAAAGRGEQTRFSAFAPTPRGTPKWWDVVVSPVRGCDGTAAQIMCALRDITELKKGEIALKEALDAKEALLYEVNHRVKNSLALVTSLLTLQSSHAKDPKLKQTLDEARSRIGVVAQVHQRLYQTNRHNDVELGAFLADIAHDVVAVFDSEGRVTLETDCAADIILGLDKAVPLALLTSELITNSLKYAFSGPQRQGVLRISLQRRDDQLHLRVCDDGPGLPDGFSVGGTGGLGMRIVGALTRQIRAQFSATNAPGACFDIVFPAESKKGTAAHTAG